MGMSVFKETKVEKKRNLKLPVKRPVFSVLDKTFYALTFNQNIFI